MDKGTIGSSRTSKPGKAKPPDLSKTQLIFVAVTELFRFLRLLAWLGGISLIAYITIYLPIHEMAGKRTIFDFAYKAIVQARLDFIVSAALAAALGILWKRERTLRKNDVQRLTERSSEMEKELDKTRTSSGLTPRGEIPKRKP